MGKRELKSNGLEVGEPEKADIVVDLSGGRLLIGKLRAKIELFEAKNKRLQAKIDLVLRELAHIEGEKTPTELRIEKALQEKPK